MRKIYKITMTFYVEKDSSCEKEVLELKKDILSGEAQKELKETKKDGLLDAKMTFEEIK